MTTPWEALIRSKFEVMGESGDEFLCRCPWHDDRGRPNLYINGSKGVYLCHSCHAKGSLDRLGESAPPDVDFLRQRLQKLQEPLPPPKFYPKSWLRQFTTMPTDYWATRGLTPDIVRKFSLGYDPLSGHHIIPFTTETGKILGVIRRTNTKPKYLDPTGVPKGKYLFGANHLRQRHLRKVALVEGPLDAIACWQARVPAVALMGSRITKDQIRVLERLGVLGVVPFLDNDSVGRASTPILIGELPDTFLIYQGKWRWYWTEKDAGDLVREGRDMNVRKFFHSAVRL